MGLIVNFLAILAGAGVAIYVFNKGKKAEEEKETLRLQQLEQYIRLAANNLSTPVDKQILSLKAFYKELSKRINVHHSPQEIISLHTRTITWISHDDFYKIFVQRKRGNLSDKANLIREPNASFDYINTAGPELKKHFLYFMDKYEKYEMHWNSNLSKINDVKDRLQTQCEIALQQNPGHVYQFLNDLNALFNTWTQMNNFQLWPITVEHFLNPLMNICRQTNGDHNALTILQMANECIMADTNTEELKRFIKQGTLFSMRQLRRCEKKILSIIDTFREMPTDLQLGAVKK